MTASGSRAVSLNSKHPKIIQPLGDIMARRYEFHKRRRQFSEHRDAIRFPALSKIMSFDDAGVDGRIFRQGRAIWHRRRAGAQVALRDEVDRDTRLVFVSLLNV